MAGFTNPGTWIQIHDLEIRMCSNTISPTEWAILKEIMILFPIYIYIYIYKQYSINTCNILFLVTSQYSVTLMQVFFLKKEYNTKKKIQNIIFNSNPNTKKKMMLNWRESNRVKIKVIKANYFYFFIIKFM